MDLKRQVSNVCVFVIFVRLCDISVLLGIRMHSAFIWFGCYIFRSWITVVWKGHK